MFRTRTLWGAMPFTLAALMVPIVGVPAHATPETDLDVDVIERSNHAVELAPVSEADAVNRVWAPVAGLEAAAVGTVTGRVLVTPVGGGSAVPATSGGSIVRFWMLSEGTYYQQGTTTTFDAEGDFSVDGLPAGSYRVEVLTFDGGWPGKEFHLNKDFWADADEIILNDDVAANLPTFTIDPIVIESGRISGADRYATSVAISQSIAPSGGVDVVYLASGVGYADALSAGPAAALEGGALLLTPPNALPTVVANELDRLNPSTVVIVGGTGTVSSRVAQQVASVVDADIVRLAGADRYATSRAVVNYAWPEGVDVLGIATGRNFPDALSAGAAVASAGGAVLLVDGNRTSLDATTRTFITSLAPQYIAIAGGTGSVTSGIASSLGGLPGSPEVERFSGADRYATARAVNGEFFATTAPDYAFIATGTGFADALAGGPLAAAYGAPIYLSDPRCLSEETYYDIVESFVREIYALGGTGSLSSRVLTGSLC